MREDIFRLRGNLSNSFSALTVNGKHHVNNKRIEVEDMLQQIEEQEEEIMQMRRQLSDYTVKEAQIQNDKCVLEKRIASMYKGFDQQRQDLIEATSKAMAYKQDVMEENIRIEYALQVAQEENLIFVSSLVPLLSHQSLHPANHDAYSIVSKLRILFKHHKERLTIAEEQLKFPQYHPLILQSHNKELSLSNSSHPELTHSSFSTSPEPLVNAGVDRLKSGEEVLNSQHLPAILEEENEPSSSSHHEADDSEEDHNGSDDYDDVDTNKPLPTIEGLQILGDPYPGNKIQASGYSRNGTTSCGFDWVRYLQDGSMHYIEGANQPEYTVTADDVDNYLAVSVQPLDDRQRKGEVVERFANDKKKITCHPDTLHEIQKSVSAGHTSFNVFVLKEFPDKWEPALLEIKKSSYTIKLNGPNTGAVVAHNKYTPTTIINLVAEEPFEFSILGPDDTEQYLRTNYGSNGISCSRDTIVLTMRLFVKRAVDKKLGKKKSRVLFFK